MMFISLTMRKIKLSHCTSFGYCADETQELVILKGHKKDQVDVSWTKNLAHMNHN